MPKALSESPPPAPSSGPEIEGLQIAFDIAEDRQPFFREGERGPGDPPAVPGDPAGRAGHRQPSGSDRRQPAVSERHQKERRRLRSGRRNGDHRGGAPCGEPRFQDPVSGRHLPTVEASPRGPVEHPAGKGRRGRNRALWFAMPAAVRREPGLETTFPDSVRHAPQAHSPFGVQDHEPPAGFRKKHRAGVGRTPTGA